MYGGCTAEAAVSEASGPRVSGCIRVWRLKLGRTPSASGVAASDEGKATAGGTRQELLHFQ